MKWFNDNVEPGETWIDIGGHYGYTALAFSKLVGSTGRVYTFEPMISTAGFLYQTVKINRLKNIVVLPFALSNHKTITLSYLHSVRGMIDSSLREEGLTDVFLEVGFDYLWPSICGDDSKIDGVKIDVQGMEEYVIKGMKEWLSREKPKIALEFHQGADKAEILDTLRKCGYHSPGKLIGVSKQDSQTQYLNDKSYAFFPDV